MSELLTYRSLQKLRFFLAGVFPFLARGPRWSDTPPKWLERFPRISTWWTTLRNSVLRANAQRVATTFALGSYGDRQLDWNKVPADAVAVLRSVTVLAALLCLLLPLAIKVAWPALPLEPITGAAGEPLAGWSVWLWMLAISLGWSCALVGTGAASRVAFVPTLVLFVYFGIVTVAALPKTWWNLLLTPQAMLALVYCESRRARGSRAELVRALLGASTGGMAAAFALIVATPMTGLFRAHLSTWVIALGVLLGALAWYLAAVLRRMKEREPHSLLVRLDSAVALLSGLYFALLVSLVARGGLVAPAQGIASFSVSVTGYLWPFYYFLGIGVVFKVLRQTKAVHGAAYELIPPRYFVPLCLSALVAATIVLWSEAVVARPALPWPRWFATASAAVYHGTSWLWTRPTLGLTSGPMKWILLVMLAVALWSLVKRRFDSGVAASLLFIALLLWLGVFEYFFEFTGFARSYRHTALTLTAFAVLVLWLTHRTLLDFLSGSSPWWPQAARIAIYAAGVMFVLLPLHARAALHEARLPNEIFLYLFFGVIDLGLPYYLYVYAQRRFLALPLSVPAMLGLFAIGVALSVPLIILDKLSIVEWSLTALWSHATAQAVGLLRGEPLPAVQAFLSPWWIVLRAAFVAAAITSAALLGRRLARDVRQPNAAVIFAAIAVAAGLASFSNRSVELPLLPQRIVQLITPMHSSVAVDASLIARHLSFFLPAMVIGIVLADWRERWKGWLGLGVALALQASIALVWPAGEPWLRSTDGLILCGTAGVVIFLWLAAALRDRLDTLLEPNASVALHARVLLAPDVRWTCASVLMLLAMLAAGRAYGGRLVPHRVARAAPPVLLPVVWQRDSARGGGNPPLALLSASSSGTPSSLGLDVRAFAPGTTRAWMQVVALEAAQRLTAYNPVKLEEWGRFYPGALALDFRYAPDGSDSGTVAFGTTALAPLPNASAIVATVLFAPSDVERRWDLARMLQVLPRPADAVATRP